MLSVFRHATLLHRLVVATALIGALMLSIAGVFLVNNARNAIEREVSAGSALARDYVIAAVGALMRSNSPSDTVRFLPGTLFQPRHVEIAVIDHRNGVTHFPRAPHLDDDDAGAPDWFVTLLSPPRRELHLPIRIGPDIFGEIIITTSPEDEIDEIWEDFVVLAWIAGLTYLATLAALFFVIRGTLRPLVRMNEAFAELEDGDFSARIGDVSTPEFSLLAERFDSLGQTVQQSIAEKVALNKRLVELQDHERRAIAMELHDELGPCLFGLQVETRAVRESAHDDKLSGHAQNILGIVRQIQIANRRILDKLRPMEVGALPLSDLLHDLADHLRPLGPDMTWTLSISDAFDDHLSDAEELHLYRIMQEAITNVLRHADASAVSVTLARDAKRPDDLVLEISDNGRGPKDPPGSGIRGMQERTQSLGGSFTLIEKAEGGCLVRVILPRQATSEQKRAS